MNQNSQTQDTKDAGNRVHKGINNWVFLPHNNQNRSILNNHSANCEYGEEDCQGQYETLSETSILTESSVSKTEA